MDLEKRKIKALIGSFLVLGGWFLVPILVQRRYGYSAIEVAFAIIVIYYVGFQVWKRFLRDR